MADGNWTIAEDIGAFRDLSDPTIFGQPDSYSNYLITGDDNGGVHTNSGIMNKAAFLITAGGTHNGVTIPGIGYAKANTLFYHRMINLPANADLPGAALDMNEVANILAWGGVNGFTQQDVCSVHNALYAVQLLNLPDWIVMG